jgi:hypothetical protein
MGKRKKKGKRRKDRAISAFGLNSVADHYETAPLYQRKLDEGDMVWLADEYRRRSGSEPSLKLEEFAAQYGVLADELREYLPELSEGVSRSVVVWHGTSKSRAESILEEGFRPKSKKGKKARMFFTRNPAVARRYAQARARGESDRPAVIMCAIDLNEYDDYERRGQGVFAFRAEGIASEVVRNVRGARRQPREKRKKRKDDGIELSNVSLTFNSGRAGIAYWVNGYLKLSGQDRIDEEHEAVGKIKRWLDDQANAGRFGEVPDDEMLKQVRKCLPQYL